MAIRPINSPGKNTTQKEEQEVQEDFGFNDIWGFFRVVDCSCFTSCTSCTSLWLPFLILISQPSMKSYSLHKLSWEEYDPQRGT
jgi:hypothetical protein